MAACGAKILHLRCVEYARRENVPIHVRSSFSRQGRYLGARAAQERKPAMEQAIISGVAHDRSEAKITIVGRSGPGRRGRAGSSRRSPRREINIDMIVQNVSAAVQPAYRHLLHPAQDRRPGRDGDAASALQGRVSASKTLLYDDRIGKVSRHRRRACGRTRVSARSSSARSPTAG